jgi:hypothetical protein
MTNADKRSTVTDALETLGTKIAAGAGRDAIHLAVEPVMAAERLLPGQHIGFVVGGIETNFASGSVGASAKTKLGIVDPFIIGAVNPGDNFWMVVYPRTITSLRHVWTHPAFGDEPAKAVDVSPEATSKAWIQAFAASVPLSYETVMEGARDYVSSKRRDGYGEYLCFGGLLEGESVPMEFWWHYEVVTGETVAEDHRGSFFTCSC